LPLATARRLEEVAPNARLVNGYGPSETAVLATLWVVATAGEASVPIGWAIPFYRILITDSALRGLPAHWPGEVLIACPAPALGYHDAEMTRTSFLELPGEAPGPFFRTGDFGWIDDTGRVQFIGRRDRQTKVFGVRIEMDGVEHHITEVNGVADAGVVLMDRPPRVQIVAVVQPAP
jgi:non-ribosomal peptide synthetase component F